MPCTKKGSTEYKYQALLPYISLVFDVFNVSSDEIGILQELQLEFLRKSVSDNLKIFSPILDNLMKNFLAKELLRGVMQWHVRARFGLWSSPIITTYSYVNCRL